MVEIAAGAPSTELAAIGKAIALVSSEAKAPTEAALLDVLQNATGARSLEGIDLGKPLQLLWLDPKRFTRPFVLVADAKNPAAFKQGLLDSPAVKLRVRKARVVLGDEAALAAVADYAFGLKPSPAGVRARVRIDRLWSSFGAQARAMGPVLMAAASGANAGGSPMVSKVLDWLFSAAEQGSALVAELRCASTRTRVDITVTLESRAGSPMSSYFALQRPSDFSLIGKLAAQRGLSFVAAGDLDASAARMFFGSQLVGATLTEAEQRDMDAMIEASTGKMAAAGELGMIPSLSMQYVAGSRDHRRQLEAYQRIQNAMLRAKVQGPSSKITLGTRRTIQEGGLELTTLPMTYDLSGLPGQAGKPPVESGASWTGWDGYLVSTVGPASLVNLRQLVASARHGIDPLVLGGAMAANLAEARAAKESFWMALDLAAISRAAGKDAILPANLLVFLGLGYGDQSARLRISLATK